MKTAEEWLEEFDDSKYDVESMRIDIENRNLDIGDDQRAAEYEHVIIVRDSLLNRQFQQAKLQCVKYGINYEVQRAIFDLDNR